MVGTGYSRLLQEGLKESGSVICTVPAEVSLGCRLCTCLLQLLRCCDSFKDGTFKKVGDILAEDWGSVHWRHRYGNLLSDWK